MRVVDAGLLKRRTETVEERRDVRRRQLTTAHDPSERVGGGDAHVRLRVPQQVDVRQC